MTIPTKTPLDVMTFHGEVPGDNVFQDRSDQMAVVGKAGRKRRPVVEYIGCGVLCLMKRLLKDIGFFPVIGDSVLGSDKRKVFVAWSGCILFRQLTHPF